MTDTPETDIIEQQPDLTLSEAQEGGDIRASGADASGQDADAKAPSSALSTKVVTPAAKQLATQDDLIASLAANPDVNVEKMQAIINMKIQTMNYQAECEFNVAMAALRKELGPVIKNRKNSQTNSKYADLDAIKKVADPLMAKHGFFDRYEDEMLEDGRIRTTCEIVHERGHSKRNSVVFAIDDKGIAGKTNKTQPHGIASAMTYGQRVSFCRALGIRIAEDDDGNAAGNQPIDDVEATTIREFLKRIESTEEKLCEALQVARIEDMNKEQYARAIRQMKKKEQMLAEEKKKVTTKEQGGDTSGQAKCATCKGTGVFEDETGKGPCPACKGGA